MKIYLYSIIDQWTQENGFIKLLLKDPRTIRNIQEFDQGVSEILKDDYTPILQYDNGDMAFILRLKPEHYDCIKPSHRRFI